jgi:hypothetical protein
LARGSQVTQLAGFQNLDFFNAWSRERLRRLTGGAGCQAIEPWLVACAIVVPDGRVKTAGHRYERLCRS